MTIVWGESTSAKRLESLRKARAIWRSERGYESREYSGTPEESFAGLHVFRYGTIFIKVVRAVLCNYR
ncbi:uncharacterized protein YALI1_C14249g [Yarrowia lipolytica]|uniref:Uncharacterized protein n=1 Tax=Yarrowia lipolytica TaxID=4952 RepID=A0A1D8NAG5_YARLL|nr:hypothetical protein YALI1_C14249g [Yarrowia lipolytica]